jgi:hypothetical protein
MTPFETAQRIKRIGQLFVVIGGGIGLAVWLFAFSGDVSRPSIWFIWPIGLGSIIGLIGLFLERQAKQSDVGRQL